MRFHFFPDNWRADNCRWKQAGFRYEGPDKTGLKKVYFYCITGEGGEYSRDFIRYAFLDPQIPNKVFVEYVGDESIALKACHGNARKPAKTQKPFYRTMPSILRDIEEHVHKGENPSKVYKTMLTEAPKEISRHKNEAVRDMKQVQNVKGNVERKLKLGPCSLYSTLEIAAEDQERFVQEIMVWPHVRIVLLHVDLVEVLSGLLNREDLDTVEVTLDTTFTMGDFYVTPFSFTETEFVNKPSIPVGFLIHETRDAEVHRALFDQIFKKIPHLGSANNVYMMMDDEDALKAALRSTFPEMDLRRCLNHVVDNVKRKLRETGVKKKADLQAYVRQVRILLDQPSRKDYDDMLINILASDQWSKVALVYVNCLFFLNCMGYFLLGFCEVLQQAHPSDSG